MSMASLPDEPHTTDRAPCHGPYQHPPVEFIAPTKRTAMLQAALDGVQLGGWDTRILTHLTTWCDTPTFLAILGWIERARTTAQTHTSSRQRDHSRAFDTYRLAMIDALEEARDTARFLLDHLGSHLDEPLAGLPGWIYDRNGYDTRPELPAGA
jgi:hypothetical protein